MVGQQIHGGNVRRVVTQELATLAPLEIVSFAVDRLRAVEMDRLFVSCRNFRALEAVKELESAFRLPVVTSCLAVIEQVRKRFE